MRFRGKIFVVFCFLSITAQLPAQDGPFSSAELDRFITDWPAVHAWAVRTDSTVTRVRGLGECALRMKDMDTRPVLEPLGWNSARFFYIAGNAGAALQVIEETEEFPPVIVQLQHRQSEITSSQALTEQDRDNLMEHIDGLITDLHGPRIEYEIPASELDLVRKKQTLLKKMPGF